MSLDSEYRCAIEAAAETIGLKAWYKSARWKDTTKLVRLLRTNCECCGTFENLQVHHTTYRHLGSEVLHLEDVRLLCDTCHRNTHGMPTLFSDGSATIHVN